MLEKPDLNKEDILPCLEGEFGLRVFTLEFLPIGADFDTAVFRVTGVDGSRYFLKLRRSGFDEIAVALPKLLNEGGIKQIISPLMTKRGRLWAGLGGYQAILYPFVAGRDGYEVKLSDGQWEELGLALRRIHTARVPERLLDAIPRETFSQKWRQLLKNYLGSMDRHVLHDAVAEQLADFISIKRVQVLDLVERAEKLAKCLQERQLAPVICHSDIHAGNIHIADDHSVYIVDWDEPILAPKERDLMYIGAGLMGNWRSPDEEEELFYRGYGQSAVDDVALAYYRCERIVQDLAVYCEQILLSGEGGEDREQSLAYLKSNFDSNSTIELAYRTLAKRGV